LVEDGGYGLQMTQTQAQAANNSGATITDTQTGKKVKIVNKSKNPDKLYDAIEQLVNPIITSAGEVNEANRIRIKKTATIDTDKIPVSSSTIPSSPESGKTCSGDNGVTIPAGYYVSSGRSFTNANGSEGRECFLCKSDGNWDNQGVSCSDQGFKNPTSVIMPPGADTVYSGDNPAVKKANCYLGSMVVPLGYKNDDQRCYDGAWVSGSEYASKRQADCGKDKQWDPTTEQCNTKAAAVSTTPLAGEALCNQRIQDGDKVQWGPRGCSPITSKQPVGSTVTNVSECASGIAKRTGPPDSPLICQLCIEGINSSDPSSYITCDSTGKATYHHCSAGTPSLNNGSWSCLAAPAQNPVNPHANDYDPMGKRPGGSNCDRCDLQFETCDHFGSTYYCYEKDQPNPPATPAQPTTPISPNDPPTPGARTNNEGKYYNGLTCGGRDDLCASGYCQDGGFGKADICADKPTTDLTNTTQSQEQQVNPAIVGGATGAVCLGTALIAGFFTGGIAAIPAAVGCLMVGAGTGIAVNTFQQPSSPAVPASSPSLRPSLSPSLRPSLSPSPITASPTFVYCSQKDPEWASNPVPGESSCNWGTSGCGIMAAAMIIGTQTGECDPEAYYKTYNEIGGIQCLGTGYYEHIQALGSLGYHNIPVEGSTANIKDQIEQYTAAGIPVWVNAYIYTGSKWVSHNTIATGVDDNGNIIFNDPWYGENVTIPDDRIDMDCSRSGCPNGAKNWKVRAFTPPESSP